MKGGDCQVGRSATVAVEALQFLTKKLREQRPWEAEKTSCSSIFGVLQSPKKLFKKRG
jgi:hypothetical protein